MSKYTITLHNGHGLSTKLLDGGWFPLTISLMIAFLMMTWRRGQEILDKARLAVRQTASDFNAGIKANPPFRIPAPGSARAHDDRRSARPFPQPQAQPCAA
jgi:hypothetical protein